MLPLYHKIFLVERVLRNALDTRFRRLICAFSGICIIALRSRLRPDQRRAKQVDPPKLINFFLFIRRFPSVKDGPGGIYLSG
jgi:hypothetical protein